MRREGGGRRVLSRLAEIVQADPIKGLALAAALIALATTPIAFAVLGRMDWFKARRGRVMQRPEFWSICCGMALSSNAPKIVSSTKTLCCPPKFIVTAVIPPVADAVSGSLVKVAFRVLAVLSVAMLAVPVIP